MRILFTGGSGRLGQEFQKLVRGKNDEWLFPSHNDLDILNISPKWKKQKFDLIIHAAAYTNVARAGKDTKEAKECFDINVEGTRNLVKNFFSTPFVYISSEYAARGTDVYSLSKRQAELVVCDNAYDSLIIRTLFKPRPYPHEYAFIDQWTQGDYVDTIANLIMKEVEHWNKQFCKLVYVGTGRKTMYDMAFQTRKDVKQNYVTDIKGIVLPQDYP